MIIIGHRGARGLAPENTIAALKKALEYDVDEIEFDVRVTIDNVIVLHHNRSITDPNGKKLRISKSTYKEIKAHKPDIATFQEALSTLKGTVPIYVEIKAGEPTKPIIALIKRALQTGWNTTDFRVASFSFGILKEIHSAIPEIELILNENWSGVRAHFRAKKLNITRISMNRLWLWSGFIKGFRPHGSHSMQLVTFTLNDPKKAAKWKSYGLYGVVTDYPDRFVKKK